MIEVSCQKRSQSANANLVANCEKHDEQTRPAKPSVAFPLIPQYLPDSLKPQDRTSLTAGVDWASDLVAEIEIVERYYSLLTVLRPIVILMENYHLLQWAEICMAGNIKQP